MAKRRGPRTEPCRTPLLTEDPRRILTIDFYMLLPTSKE